MILKVSPDEDYVWPGAARRALRLCGDHGDQHRQGAAPRPRDRRAVAQEPLRRGLGPGDQADRPAGRRRAARRGHPAADHRQRRDPRLRRLPRVLLGGRRRGQPRVGGLAAADAALRARPGRGPADPPPDRADGGVRAARRGARTGSRPPRSTRPAPEVVAEPVAGHQPERGRAPQGVTASTGSGSGPDCRIGASRAGVVSSVAKLSCDAPVEDLAR